MLKVWLPLNGDLHNQGCSNVTVTNNGATVNASGKIGSCYYFNASSYLYENTYNWTNFNTTQFSLCCWYKQPSPVASGNSQIICIGTNSGWNNIRIGLLRRTSNGYPMFSVSNGSSAIQYNCTATTFSLDTWNHIACTYDNGTIKIYLNGTLDKTYTTTIVPVLNSSQHLGVGAASNGAEKLTGYLNDVRIYDHCLSAAEVKEISQGLVLHYKLDSIQDGILDSSGYGHKTSIIGTLMLDEDDSARYTNSIKFNGSNTAIKITENNWAVQGMREMTINVWAKSSSWSGAHLFSCTESGGFNTENGSSGYLRFPVNVYTNAAQTSTAYKYDSQEIQISALSTDKWNMLTFVYDSTGTRTYINGILHHTYTNVSYGIHFNLNARLFLGCEANGASAYSPYFNGKMNDFRIYCTALSADDILQLYHTSAKIDNKKNLHTYELIENSPSIKINKRGQTLCNELQEGTAMKFYKTDSIIETHVLNEF